MRCSSSEIDLIDHVANGEHPDDPVVLADGQVRTRFRSIRAMQLINGVAGRGAEQGRAVP